VLTSDFYSISRTKEELSIVCHASIQIESDKSETGWSCIKVMGPLDFEWTGILANLSQTLSDAGISMFALSTYDTDYILIKAEKLEAAKTVLLASGHRIIT